MLYHLFKYLDEVYDLPGSGMFQYISFRAAAAVILSLLIVIIFGRRIIDFLRRKQIGEEIRDLGLEGQLQKRGTPTMGGVIILVAILVPTMTPSPTCPTILKRPLRPSLRWRNTLM